MQSGNNNSQAEIPPLLRGFVCAKPVSGKQWQYHTGFANSKPKAQQLSGDVFSVQRVALLFITLLATLSASAQKADTIKPKVRFRDALPLIVLNDVVYTGQVADILPADIQSYSFIKDSTSRARYGPAAENGVIRIGLVSGVTYTNPVAADNKADSAQVVWRYQQKIGSHSVPYGTYLQTHWRDDNWFLYILNGTLIGGTREDKIMTLNKIDGESIQTVRFVAKEPADGSPIMVMITTKNKN